jgi:hypothetical protein
VILLLVIAAICELLAALAIRSALSQWRGGGGLARFWARGGVPPERAIAYDRSAVPMALMMGFVGLLLLSVAVTGPRLGPGTGGLWAAAAFLVLSLLSGIVYWTVMQFNKPRFLVPPRLRAEPGLAAIRRRSRGRPRGPADMS